MKKDREGNYEFRVTEGNVPSDGTIAGDSESLDIRHRLPILAALVLAAIAMSGCGRRAETALGRIREITVATNRWPVIEPLILKTLQDTVLTPQPEPRFLLRRYDADQFSSYRLLRTVFLVGTLEDTVVRAVLGTRADSLPGGDCGLFRIPNAWADNQQLVVFAARNDSALVPGFERYRDRIRSTFRGLVLEHSTRAVYFRGRNEEASNRLLTEYSFGLDVPRGWYVKEYADSQFVYLFGHYPDRSVFVFWEDSVRPLVAGELLELRDRLVGRYYAGDRTERSWVQAESVGFLAGPALRLEGIWQNDERTMGGPFVSLCFNHGGRFFMLDGLVFLPGKPKLDQMLAVEAVLRSFVPR